jgi:hypothetical protein
MDEMQTITGWRLVELFWPLNDMFRARLRELRSLSYDPAFEAEADAALIAFSERPDAGAWSSISPGAWRVLLERHQQLLEVALLNEAAGNPVTSLPRGLSEDDQRIGIMLLLLLRMTLPFPPADRSRLEFPASPPARGH